MSLHYSLSCCTQDLHSPARDWASVPLLEGRFYKHWITRKVPKGALFNIHLLLKVVMSYKSGSERWLANTEPFLQREIQGQVPSTLVSPQLGMCTSSQVKIFATLYNSPNDQGRKCRVYWLGVTNISRRISNTECVNNEDWSV